MEVRMWAQIGMVAALAAMHAPAKPIEAGDSVGAALNRLAEDYRRDPLLVPGAFGVEVDGRVWTIDVKGRTNGAPALVTVRQGEPEVPTFVYKMNRATFERITLGQWTAATAMAKARAEEPAPLEFRPAKGFRPGPDFRARFLSTTFHFWTPGYPERVGFGFKGARTVHGGEAVVLHYEPGLRSAWYGVWPGQHVNKERKDQVNDYPSLFIVLKAGSAKARIGGEEIKLHDRQSIHVPAGVAHELWNPGRQAAELIMVAFGPTA